MTYKTGKWAQQITALQHDDGSWGYFHSLSNPSPQQPITTEQALTRLEILGFTIDDKPIKRAVKYLNDCLIGKNKIPDREEKVHNWKIFTGLMLSARIRIFTSENKAANDIAAQWAYIINNSYKNKCYDHNAYIYNFEHVFKIKMDQRAGRLIDFCNFYPVSLLTNILDKNIEPYFFKYVLENENGIYYKYDKKLTNPPQTFQGKNVSKYLSAIELLAKYRNPECKWQLRFIKTWLQSNSCAPNEWDMGADSKDNIHFPLSDSWRTRESRIIDCTRRIRSLLEKL